MKRLLIKIIKFYQNFLSPFLPATCRFYPSCSQYMIDAVEKYGIFKGLRLGSFRILKCNPFNSGGYDPLE